MAKSQDIFSQLKQDHRTVESLFKRLETTTERGAKTRDKLYARLRMEISRHAQAEESILYPRLKRFEPLKDIAFESIEEHSLVKHLLGRLDSLAAEDEEWMAALCVLREVISHHVKEEEGEMFRLMKRHLDKAELLEMGKIFPRAKKGIIERIVDAVAA